MRGFPPLHLLLFCLAFVALAVPLTRLTFARAVPPPITASDKTAADEQDKMVHTLLRLRFSHVPEHLELRHLVPADAPALVTLSSGSATGSSVEESIRLPLNDHGIELALEATWPDHTPDAAVTVELEPDGLDVKSQTLWSSNGSISEILIFQWQP